MGMKIEELMEKWNITLQATPKRIDDDFELREHIQ
jgi:hypothetical protein